MTNVTPIVTPTPNPFDPNLRVFAVDVTFPLHLKLYVLALNVDDVATRVEALQEEFFDDLLTYDNEDLWVTESAPCEIDFIGAGIADLENIEQLASAEYDPKDHPDWGPGHLNK